MVLLCMVCIALLLILIVCLTTVVILLLFFSIANPVKFLFLMSLIIPFLVTILPFSALRIMYLLSFSLTLSHCLFFAITGVISLIITSNISIMLSYLILICLRRWIIMDGRTNKVCVALDDECLAQLDYLRDYLRLNPSIKRSQLIRQIVFELYCRCQSRDDVDDYFV